MTKDKALEEMFLSQQPHFDDKADFMATLTRRLDAVEYVRRYQETTLRRYRMAMVAAFVVGIISGAVTLAFVLSMPADVPLFLPCAVGLPTVARPELPYYFSYRPHPDNKSRLNEYCE